VNKVIWSCWFQGRSHAPPLVERCLSSWERSNPGWEFRCLDQHELRRYVELPDIGGKRITYASLSDILRILLLKEYGGVWVDATTFCHQPLEDWLEPWFREGFFGFDRPGGDRPLSSWFLASEESHTLVDRWCARTLAYWSERTRAHGYFWFHDLFRDLCETDAEFGRAWARVPKLSAAGPHAIQRVGMFEKDAEKIADGVDWLTPVFKLTYRFDDRQYVPGTLLWRLLESDPTAAGEGGEQARPRPAAGPSARLHEKDRPTVFASLKVSTRNLGDHIQILAGLELLQRFGIEPTLYIDRDDEIASCGMLRPDDGRVALLLNGWFKTNGREWPPNERIQPIFLGFHIRLFQCPELLSDEAVRYYQAHQPIGCRDAHTRELLEARNVECFDSNCLSLSFPRRRDAEIEQRRVFVASRDRRVLDILPPEIGPYIYVNHYSDTSDFPSNLTRARELLRTYRTQAGLIVTTFLHCALPAIAMGIPVVVLYPENDAKGHQSDRERFSSLEKLVPIYRFSEVDRIDWAPRPVDTSRLKLTILDSFFALSQRWALPGPRPLAPIAPAAELPAPDA
jgi:hypothetical protein